MRFHIVQTDGKTDGRYQVHYLPRFAVDNKTKCHHMWSYLEIKAERPASWPVEGSHISAVSLYRKMAHNYNAFLTWHILCAIMEHCCSGNYLHNSVARIMYKSNKVKLLVLLLTVSRVVPSCSKLNSISVTSYSHQGCSFMLEIKLHICWNSLL